VQAGTNDTETIERLRMVRKTHCGVMEFLRKYDKQLNKEDCVRKEHKNIGKDKREFAFHTNCPGDEICAGDTVYMYNYYNKYVYVGTVRRVFENGNFSEVEILLTHRNGKSFNGGVECWPISRLVKQVQCMSGICSGDVVYRNLGGNSYMGTVRRIFQNNKTGVAEISKIVRYADDKQFKDVRYESIYNIGKVE
ncbi:MAG: hypothetical protein AAB116_24970, partial [Candidatus Poribacteria bacterium]